MPLPKINILLNLLCWLVFLPSIKSDCVIEYTNIMDIGPNFEKEMGKFKIKVPLSENDERNFIKIQDREIVYGYCETQFSPIIYEVEESLPYDYYYRGPEPFNIVQREISDQTAGVFKCMSSKLLFNNTYELRQQNLSCLPQSWSIYSVKKPYEWCERHYNSSTFLISANRASGLNILAAVCYHTEQLSLQTLVYNTTTLQQFYLRKAINGVNAISSENLDEHLWNFKTSIVTNLNGENLQKKLYVLAKRDEWLNLANYEVSLIVQDELLMKYFQEYENILNIIWWRNLRLGNWKRFQKALTSHANKNSYEVYIGTSGVAQYPIDDKSPTERFLEIKFGYKKETVPAYIWAYLKSNDHLNQTFLMVGFNSAYAEFFKTDNIIFCPDICSEIPWLEAIASSFRYANAGIMFCCSTEFVRQAKYLQDFPMEILQSQQFNALTVEATEVTTTEYVTDSSEENFLEV